MADVDKGAADDDKIYIQRIDPRLFAAITNQQPSTSKGGQSSSKGAAKGDFKPFSGFVRPDSSLYTLNAFNPAKTGGKKKPIEMEFGPSYVAFKGDVKLDDMPEILHHFSKILRGEETKSTTGKTEEDVDLTPYLDGYDFNGSYKKHLAKRCEKKGAYE